jgi:hypothetical protein
MKKCDFVLCYVIVIASVLISIFGCKTTEKVKELPQQVIKETEDEKEEKILITDQVAKKGVWLPERDGVNEELLIYINNPGWHDYLCDPKFPLTQLNDNRYRIAKRSHTVWEADGGSGKWVCGQGYGKFKDEFWDHR